jgi:hypothetical protein
MTVHLTEDGVEAIGEIRLDIVHRNDDGQEFQEKFRERSASAAGEQRRGPRHETFGKMGHHGEEDDKNGWAPRIHRQAIPV